MFTPGNGIARVLRRRAGEGGDGEESGRGHVGTELALRRGLQGAYGIGGGGGASQVLAPSGAHAGPRPKAGAGGRRRTMGPGHRVSETGPDGMVVGRLALLAGGQAPTL